jgi:hypothetical protein
MMSVRKSAGAGSFVKLDAGCDAPLMAYSMRPDQYRLLTISLAKPRSIAQRVHGGSL